MIGACNSMTANETQDLIRMGSPIQTIAKFTVHSIHRVFATIKNYLLSLYCVRVLKPLRISHIKLGPLW